MSIIFDLEDIKFEIEEDNNKIKLAERVEYKEDLISEEQKRILSELCFKIVISYKSFNPYIFIAQCIRRKIHPEAIIKSFQSILSKKVDFPKEYCEKIISIESGNKWEDEYIQNTKSNNIFKEIADKLKLLMTAK